MTHREQLLILAALIVLVLLAILFPRPAASDVPVPAGMVPAGEFERVSLPFPHHVGTFLPNRLAGDKDFYGHLTDASRSHRVGTHRIAPGSPAPIVTPSPVAAPATASPSASLRVPTPTPVRIPAQTERAVAVTGTASWFRSPAGVSAAGPALRRALGSGWRGMRVRVTGPAGWAVVTLGDWMRADRLIDLDVHAFPAVCGPLSRGICEAKVTW